MTDRLDEIRARAEAATPGPWGQGNINSGDGISLLDVYSEHAGYVKVASVWDSEDRDFIAHAREDIPYLLAEVERLRAALTLACRDGWSDWESAATYYVEQAREWLATTEGDER